MRMLSYTLSRYRSCAVNRQMGVEDFKCDDQRDVFTPTQVTDHVIQRMRRDSRRAI